MWWLGALLILAVLANIVLLFNRRKTDRPGLIQIRVNGMGCVQYDHIEGPTFILECVGEHLWLIVPFAAAVSIVLFWQRLIDRVLFWSLMPILVVASIALWSLSDRVQFASGKLSDRAIADRNEVWQRLTPWTKVCDFMLGQLREGVYRFRVDKRIWFLTEYPIDAEIRCTPEQADDLREWLENRIGPNGGLPGK
jgi:hypothetical protein